MARAKSIFRNQTKALLIRTWHWQRRQTCNNICNFIVPPALLILLTILSRSLVGREEITYPFQQKPKGAFAPRPFEPNQCGNLVRQFGVEEAVDKCVETPFIPDYEVPVAFPEDIREDVGQVNKTAPDNPEKNKGLLKGISLMPFIYPGAIEGPFAESQTQYDGVFKSNFLPDDDYPDDAGEKLEQLYEGFLVAEKDGETDSEYKVRSKEFSSVDALKTEVYENWFRGNALPTYSTALAFERIEETDTRFSISATVFYNESISANCTEACPLVSNVMRTENAIFQKLAPGKSAVAYLRRMPLIDVRLSVDFLPLVISITIGFFSHFWFPTLLRFIVLERVSRLRAMMSMMGLKRREYWIGTYLGLFTMFALSKLLLILIGAAVSIPFYVDNAAISYLILFFLWGNVLVAFAMALAPFFGNPETAQVVGWLFIIVVNVVGGPYLGTRLGDEETSEGTWAAIMLLPSFAYLRSVYFAGALNSGGKGVVVGSETYNDVELGMCQGDGPFCRSYAFLAVEWVVLMLLAAYFDRVLPGAVGNRLHPLFIFGFKRKAAYAADEEGSASEKGEDVKEEESRAASIVENIAHEPFDGVVLNRLSKTYPGKPPVEAVKGLSLIAGRNEVLCILAHNGGGKTSFFRTLVGELEATSGTAYVNSNSILTDMDKVHRCMGVAPQQNILWDVLSVQEHLYFYGRVKNLSGEALKDSVEQSLQSVQLGFARKRRADKLSGGMKRRLSVSIAMIGSPDFIILDEPSTGLDLLAREKLWEAIDRAKENTAVMLTTHSLDEAETLSSRVAIMSRGELRCIGRADELKLRLGKGHHLSVSLPTHKFAELHDAVMEIAPGAVIETRLGGSVEYVLPKNFTIPEVFKFMEDKREKLEIRDWAINESTLEDVFLEVTHRSAEEQAKIDDMVAP